MARAKTRKPKRTETVRQLERRLAFHRRSSRANRAAQVGMVPIVLVTAVGGATAAAIISLFLLSAVLPSVELWLVLSGLLVLTGLLVPPLLVARNMRRLGQRAAHEKMSATAVRIRLDEARDELARSGAGRADAGLSLAHETEGQGALSLEPKASGGLTVASAPAQRGDGADDDGLAG